MGKVVLGDIRAYPTRKKGRHMNEINELLSYSEKQFATLNKEQAAGNVGEYLTERALKLAFPNKKIKKTHYHSPVDFEGAGLAIEVKNWCFLRKISPSLIRETIVKRFRGFGKNTVKIVIINRRNITPTLREMCDEAHIKIIGLEDHLSESYSQTEGIVKIALQKLVMELRAIYLLIESKCCAPHINNNEDERCTATSTTTNNDKRKRINIPHNITNKWRRLNATLLGPFNWLVLGLGRFLHDNSGSVHLYKIPDILARIYARIRGRHERKGKILALIGGMGSGKSTTARAILKRLSGRKVVINLQHTFDKEDRELYEEAGAHVLDDLINREVADIPEGEAILVHEDFPKMPTSTALKFYNKIIQGRHAGIDTLIVCHDPSVLSKDVFTKTNYFAFFSGAGITTKKLLSILPLEQARSVAKRVSELKLGDYCYYFLSNDHKRWLNPPINGRDVDVLGNALNDKIKGGDLSDIPHIVKGETGQQRPSNKPLIEKEIIAGGDYRGIADKYGVTYGYVRVVRTELSKRGMKLPDRRKK